MVPGLGRQHVEILYTLTVMLLIVNVQRRNDDGRLVDHVRALWQRKFNCNCSYTSKLLFLLLHERKRSW